MSFHLSYIDLPVIIILPRSVPQPQVDRPASHHDVGSVVVEDGGDVLTREGVSGVGNKEAGLAHATVPHHHTLDHLHCLLQTRHLGHSLILATLCTQQESHVKLSFY